MIIKTPKLSVEGGDSSKIKSKITFFLKLSGKKALNPLISTKKSKFKIDFRIVEYF